MSAAHSRQPHVEHAAALARLHAGSSARHVTSPSGPQLKRQLARRLDRILTDIGELPQTADLRFLGLDWLDQNHHIVFEALEQIQVNLPRAYLRTLPAVRSPAGAEEPRIMPIANAIAHGAALPLDMEWAQRFLTTYQRDVALSLGELWALPTFLRSSIVSSLCDALRDGVDAAAAGAAEAEHSEIAARISGCILSLRLLAATDWREFVESQSAVETELRNDPSGHYAKMTPESRSRYRQRVERIARRLEQPEVRVAGRAVELAARSSSSESNRRKHVGYYLIDDGVAELTARLRGKPRSSAAARRELAKRAVSWTYLAAIAAPTVLSVAAIFGLLKAAPLGTAAASILSVLALVPALSFWTDVVNWLVTQTIPTRVLPRLDFTRGIPDECETAVVVPCMLTDIAEIDRLVAALETDYLGNDLRRLRFLLLSDYVDADEEERPGDRLLLEHAVARIDSLNRQYAHTGELPFAILHRKRLWNENSELWMGWERKRGKIVEFNAWLLGASDTSFSLMHGDIEALQGIKYVITLDADNQLLPNVAAELVGTLAHPLNRAEFDESGSRVISGYSVIQPRVELHPASANRTRFSRLMSGDIGIDLYHLPVSEAYQDLFGQGIFAGKGIYDVRAFTQSVEGLIPANAVLSHDLLEGILGRAALASDIVVLENASPNLIAELKRQHRWVRGDWQLLPWLFGRARGEQRKKFGPIGRWKLFDNLRRSLLPSSLLGLLLGGWIALPDHSGVWTAGVAAISGLGVIHSILGELGRSTLRWGSFRSSVIRITGNVANQLAQWLMKLWMLPIVAAATLDAITRTLTRVYVTRRRLLEWTPSAQAEWQSAGATLSTTYRQMLAAPLAAALAGLTMWLAGSIDPWPLTFALAWFFAPLGAWLLAAEAAEPPPLQDEDEDELRMIARRTWQFYERFVGPETHWLPPDNYQEAPKLAVAERTSPTNIGLFLLGTVAANELGFIGALGMITRIDGTTQAFERMRRFRGHLFNWYNTRDLSVLEPAYVSTVDSGNLIAALLVCRNALDEMEASPLPHRRAAASLRGIVANIDDIVRFGSDGSGRASSSELDTILRRIRLSIDDSEKTATDWNDSLAALSETLCVELDTAVLAIIERQGGSGWSAENIDTLRTWINQLRYEATVLRKEIGQMLACLAELGGADSAQSPATPESMGELLNLIETGEKSGAEIAPREAIDRTRRRLTEIVELRDRVRQRIDAIIADTDFSFLFDAKRKLFHIGYNNTTGELDGSYYDLLASEARIASLIAVAKRDTPVSHWVHLGRPLRRIGGMRVVLSWSATTFEYLMPRLFMHTPDHGILHVSCRAVVREQLRQAGRRHVPWGVSESAYFDLDQTGHYKYFAFGIDTLALRRPTRQRYVVSPYASILALPFDPSAVVANLKALRSRGAWGRYGFYEALDFGRPEQAAVRPRVVQSFMAHHQGMILGALANALRGDVIVRRFHANPEIAAVEHLLHEARPKRAADRVIRRMPPARPRMPALMTSEHVRVEAGRRERFVAAVGNGHLTVRATGCGGGDVAWNDYAISRWQPRTDGATGGDTTYLKDLDSGALYRIGVEPETAASTPEFWCAPHQTELHQRFGGLVARLAVAVAPDNDVAFRRIILTNESRRTRRIVLTHYAEMVLAPAANDRRHPAFNKLFIESEFVAESSALLFSRRRRSDQEAALYCAVGVVAPGMDASELGYCCDRRSFLGRAGSRSEPRALAGELPDFKRRTGAGVDPVAALSVTLEVPPGATIQVIFTTAVSSRRESVLGLHEHFATQERVNFAVDQARRRVAAELTALSADSLRIARFHSLYSDMLWPEPFTEQAYATLRHTGSIIGALWSHGISGDYPICMAWLTPDSETAILEELLALQAFLDLRGIAIDIIVANEAPASYAAPVRNRVEALVDKYRRPAQRGRAFVLPFNELSPAERNALAAAAQVHVDAISDSGASGPYRASREQDYLGLPGFVPVRAVSEFGDRTGAVPDSDELEFDAGFGGLERGSDDYVIRTSGSDPTPAPWINVLANPDFGSIVAETGSTSTWFRNSSEQRLTSWSNDPVLAGSGESLYLRDEETGEYWSPTPRPVPGDRRYVVRHGKGVTTFEHGSQGMSQRVDVFVDQAKPVKFYRLRLADDSGRPRRITVTLYVEWVFGNHYEDTSPYVIPEVDEDQRTLLARNAQPRFHDAHTAFVTSTEPLHGFTTDRREFLGSARDPARPEALRRIGLSGSIVAGSEPCCAYQIHVNLEAHGQADVGLAIGAGKDREAAIQLSRAVSQPDAPSRSQLTTVRYWEETLGGIRVSTPNRAMDAMLNRWLPYQNLAGRLWARSGLYQSAGGFGFRDQLQDSLGLIHTLPEITRRHIIQACSVQFPEGDVLHWWHEDPTRGVRTRCSDDLLWLPYAVSEYLAVTGDTALLDESVCFLDGEPLRPDEHERYTEYAGSEIAASVYEHCCRAIEARAATGLHGLPLIGGGDWNDGMNRIGIEGRGESVWLGWFLGDVYGRFGIVAEGRGDRARAETWRQRRAELVESLEREAWDGNWYRRAYYDDGSTVGSAADDECRIDLNAQTWPAITGLALPERARRALDAVDRLLVDDDERLIKLLAPPFDKTSADPGYIKGYPPGVRENGGQYTHAATWAVWAAAALRRPELAMRWMDYLNPLLRVTGRDAANRYRGEPYVLAGDVYSVAPQKGQSGWTWYTGSAGWLYRIAIERILGIRIRAGVLNVLPCVPDDWREYSVDYRAGRSRYRIDVLDPAAIAESGADYVLDGRSVPDVRLVDDESDHVVRVSPQATDKRGARAKRSRTSSSVVCLKSR